MILNAFPITEYVFGDNQAHAQIITVVKEDMMKQLLYVLLRRRRVHGPVRLPPLPLHSLRLLR